MTPPNDMPADTELREQIGSLTVAIDTHLGTVQSLMIQQPETLDAVMQLIKARDAAIRIDENHNWLRFVGAAWDAEPVTAHDLHDRIAELSTPTDQKEKAE